MMKQQREYRNYSRFFFFSAIAFSGFLIYAVLNGSGFSRLISTVLFGFLIFQQLRLAFLMRRKAQDLDLK
ncbi:MAG: hypothetical protein LH614_08990 [Pyrinomonadaceae bacterium]|nr:hypothetical protein [Pyrinomonadaceae bacterium]